MTFTFTIPTISTLLNTTAAVAAIAFSWWIAYLFLHMAFTTAYSAIRGLIGLIW